MSLCPLKEKSERKFKIACNISRNLLYRLKRKNSKEQDEIAPARASLKNY